MKMTKQELWERVAVSAAGAAYNSPVKIADEICAAWEERFCKPQEKPRLLLEAYSDWFSVRTENCLRAANILYVDELARMKDSELLRLRQFGRMSLKEVREFLTTMERGANE